MQTKPLHITLRYGLLLLCLLTSISLLTPANYYWKEVVEVEEEFVEGDEEQTNSTNYAYGDGDDDNKQALIKTVYWTSSKLFSFLGQNDSNAIATGVASFDVPPALPFYLLYQQLLLDYCDA